jgi:hypothetical protein
LRGGENLDKKVDKLVPVMFQKIKEYENQDDTRFMDVKIWLCHTGENHNGSFFSEEVLENAIPSLANTPILAYIEDNSDNETDFSDHRMVLVKEEGEFSVKYIGQAIGLIPETNNAQFEMRLCDDGVERKFLTCEGLVWAKWDEPIDIFDRDSVKSQSMELHDDYEGEWKDDGLFHFNKVSFFGACALGKDVLPAMHNATIEKDFSQANLYSLIQEKMEQHKKYCLKGGSSMDEKLELLKKYSFTSEFLKEKEVDIEKFSVEELEGKLKEYSLTAGQLKQELRAELYKDATTDEWGYSYSNYWYVDHTEDLLIAEDKKDHYRLVAFKYNVVNDTATVDLDSKAKIKISYETIDGDSAVEDTSFTSKDRADYELKVKEKQVTGEFEKEKTSFEALETETQELRNFKEETLKKQREDSEEALFANFEKELTEDELTEIKNVASEYSLDELENKLYALVGKKKAAFNKSTKKEKQILKIDVTETDDKTSEVAYGGLFEKYGNK